MAFRKKFSQIVELTPDLLIVQECEHKSKLKDFLDAGYNDLIWYGENENKGVAIVSFNQTKIELSSDFNKEFQYVIPINLTHKGKEVNLFAVRAMPHKTDRSKRYIGQVWGAINYYNLDSNSIMVGDFNSNAIRDKIKRIGNHSDVVDSLNKKDIYSIYHLLSNEKHGEESKTTLHFTKKIEKPYHIDYCFTSKNLISEKTTFEIGVHQDWLSLSDHMPIIIDGITL